MNLIDKFVFPKPKSDHLKQQDQQNLIFIPAFNTKGMLPVLRTYALNILNLARINNKSLPTNRSLTPSPLMRKIDPIPRKNTQQEKPSDHLKDSIKMFNKINDDIMIRESIDIYGKSTPKKVPLSNPKQENVKPTMSKLELSRKLLKSQMSHYIPLLFFRSKSNKMLIYFHSNAEDITMLASICRSFRSSLNCSVIAFEYAGYSVYRYRETSTKNIQKDCDILIEFLTQFVGYNQQDIILAGRSIGSGPCCYLASKQSAKYRMIVLISANKSIKRVAEEKFGILGKLVDHYFNNEDLIKQNTSPLLILHGEEDELVSAKHSQTIYDNAYFCIKVIDIIKGMTHNRFDYQSCVVNRVVEFENSLEYLKSKEEARRTLTKNLEEETEDKRLINHIHSLFKTPIFDRDNDLP